MIDRDLDAELRDRLERLSAAVPIEPGDARVQVPRMTPIGRATWRSPIGLSAATILSVAVLVVVGAGLVNLGRHGGPGASDTDGSAPISATTNDGPFQLTIRADHGRYTPTDAITIEASLVYTGPDPAITISHGYGGPTAFGIVEPVHGVELTPSWLTSCNASTLDRDVAITTPFGKSGSVEASDPQADLKRQFLTDPVLRLPPGTWHVYAVSLFDLGGCGGDEHQIRAELTIEVAGPVGPTATSEPTPTEVAPTVTPSLVATDTASDGQFSLTLSASRSQYAEGEPIDVSASLASAGPASSVQIAHAAGAAGSPIAFGIVEPVAGGLQLEPGWDSVCEHTTLDANAPIVVPFAKSGSYSSSDPRAADYRAFLSDPQLVLPAGIWHIFAVADLDVGECGAERHQLRAEITIAVGAVGGVQATAEPSGVFLDACTGLGFSLNKCAGFAAWAIGQAGIQPGHVERIEMTRLDCPDGSACPTEATGYLVNVHLVTAEGRATDEVVNCTRTVGALGINFLCDEIAAGDGRTLQYPSLSSAVIAGYRDVPCSGEGPTGCATPLPSIEPSALADSTPLSIDSLEIPIDHAGPYSIVLGQASLPNGILSAATAEITSSPANPLVAYEGYHLTITSLDGGPPFDNYYAHGWRAGVEHVEVTLDFNVLMFEPGAKVVVEGVDVH